ncbi:right-handed parallel beta-helix repeat-containing protein [Haloarchaeobius amylolyticus]|uniref:right-handed parallel beta-helix repeat-containing protein n=1 Tax=Haloarchaeobius amylolyticus TaxID=1198296 RepID=UPI00226F91E7|nr:right-handed parallel beta-helix repeat-containing protein [Haloarchaeobius amylolyticus]
MVDIVDAGADPTGEEPIDGVLAEVADDDTLVEFPDGRYKINRVDLYDTSNLGLRGVGDDVTLVADEDHAEDFWIAGASTRDLLFENFTLDHTGDGVDPSVEFGSHDGLVVRNIVKKGSQDGDNTAFGFRTYHDWSETLVENLQLPDGSKAVGPVGIWVDGDGTTTFRDCHVEGYGNNGLYASWSNGPVHVEGGVFKDNDRAQVRLGSAGSYVDGAEVVVDDPSGDDPCTGVRISDGLGPVTISDCDISMTGGRGTGAVFVAEDGGHMVLEDSRIHVGPDYTANLSGGTRTSPGVYVDEAPDAPELDHDIVRTSITGGGDYYPAIVGRRDDVNVLDSCIQWDGPVGIRFHGTTANDVKNTNITVDGPAIEGDAEVVDVTSGDSCPMPNLGGGGDDGSSSDDGGDSSGSLADVPLPINASRMTYPTMGTSNENPTLTVYGNFVYPNTKRFVEENLPAIVSEFVEPGHINVQFRSIAYPTGHYLNSVEGEERLAQLALGVWDKNNWENYWGVFEYLFANQGDIEWQTWGDAKNMLQDAGVERVAGWLPGLASDDYYGDEVYQSRLDAADAGLDYVPQVEFQGDLADANMATGDLLEWIGDRL